MARLGLALLAAVLLAPGCQQTPNEPAPKEPARTSGATGVLSVGSVSLNPGREYQTFRPFADYLASRLGEVGIGNGRVVVADSLSKMVADLQRGSVDLFIDSPFPVAFVCDRAGSRPILRRWKRGSDVYHSVIFVRADSGIASADDFRGRIIAFGEPFSTTGFFLPKAALASSGLKLVNYEDPAATIQPDHVGYVFSNDAENTMFWVLKKKVAAGAVNADYFEALAGSRIEELRIIHRTEEVPRNVVCVRDGLDPELIRAVEEVLLAMDEDPQGRSVLSGFEQTARFDRFPGGSADQLGRVMELLAYVEEDLGR